MKNLTVIIPIHKYDDEVSTFLNKALESVATQKSKPETVLLVIREENKKGIAKIVKDFNEKLSFKVVINKECSCVQSQLNCGVKHTETEFFSYLEYDDTYNDFWFSNVEKYIKQDNEKIYLPITKLFNEDLSFIGFSNEEPWASSFSDEIGYIDYEVLQYYANFRPSGLVMKKETYEKLCGLKTNIKISFWYEFLLRATKENEYVYVIPKMGYNHILDRVGGFDEQSFNTYTKEEIEYWFKKAKEECFYKENREIE